MKAFMLYRPNSERARVAEEYVRDFSKCHRIDLQLLDIDSVEGVQKLELYDIMQTPAILVMRDTGEQVGLWQDAQLPLMSEVVASLVS